MTIGHTLSFRQAKNPRAQTEQWNGREDEERREPGRPLPGRLALGGNVPDEAEAEAEPAPDLAGRPRRVAPPLRGRPERHAAAADGPGAGGHRRGKRHDERRVVARADPVGVELLLAGAGQFGRLARNDELRPGRPLGRGRPEREDETELQGEYPAKPSHIFSLSHEGPEGHQARAHRARRDRRLAERSRPSAALSRAETREGGRTRPAFRRNLATISPARRGFSALPRLNGSAASRTRPSTRRIRSRPGKARGNGLAGSMA